MKKSNFIILLVACFALFPLYHYATNAKRYKNEQVKASGIIVNKTVEVKSFHGVDVSPSIWVILDDTPEGQVRIETDSVFQKYVSVKVNNGILEVQIKGSLSTNNARKDFIKVHAPIGGVNRIEAAAFAAVVAKKTIDVPKFYLNLSSGSSFEGEIACSEANIEVSSSACAKLSGKAANLEIEANSSGKVDFTTVVSEKIICDVSSAGNLTLVGVTDTLSIDVNSSGRVNAKKMAAVDVTCTASSSGKASTYANGILNLKASSGGRILYGGNYKEIYTNTSLGGSIAKE